MAYAVIRLFLSWIVHTVHGKRDLRTYGLTERITRTARYSVDSTERVKTLKKYTVGYARVSTQEQNLERQLDALNAYGVDKIYTEKMSGTKKHRPELDSMMERLETGDTVVIESLSRLGRSTKDLLSLVDTMEEKGVKLISLKENIDTGSSTGRLLLTVLSALAQFERDVIVERTNEGLVAARARGRKGGRPKVPDAKIQQAIKLYNTKEYSLREIENLTGVKPNTLYRRIHQKE